ncbi:MAG: sulfur transferase domain-containing protein, partial [Planctomycetota bacterium]
MSCIILASIGLGGCNAGPDAPSDAQPTAAHDDDPEPIEIHRHAGFLVSGQPDEQALRDIAGEGVGTLINCRSVEETDELAFDQASLASELGMNYVHVPTGGDDGYSPEQLAAFTRAVRDAKGPVYVHCAS